MTRRKFSRKFRIEAVRLVTDRAVAPAPALTLPAVKKTRSGQPSGSVAARSPAGGLGPVAVTGSMSATRACRNIAGDRLGQNLLHGRGPHSRAVAHDPFALAERGRPTLPRAAVKVGQKGLPQ